MEEAIKAMLATQRLYGQEQIQLVFTDKPASDKRWLLDNIPSLNETEERLREGLPLEAKVSELAPCAVDDGDFDVVSGVKAINTKLSALRSLLGSEDELGRTIGLDAEWSVNLTNQGPGGKNGKVALLQLAYWDSDSYRPKALLLQLKGLSELPYELRALLSDPR